jgi:ribosomal protein L29
MDLHKLKMADVRGIDAAKLNETAKAIRLELAKIRMDIYTAKGASAAKVRGLRTALARVMTFRTEQMKKMPKAAPKAPAAVKAPAKAKAPKAAKAEAAPKAAKAAPKAKAAKPAAKTKAKSK